MPNSTTHNTNQQFLVEEQGTGQKLSRNRQDIKIISRIRELASYEIGWYGSDSLAASPEAIKEAETFARKLDLNNIHPPYISLAKDGEINFWWDIEKIKLDLGFYGDGTYSYYAKFDDGSEILEDEADSNSDLPLEILEKLKK